MRVVLPARILKFISDMDTTDTSETERTYADVGAVRTRLESAPVGNERVVGRKPSSSDKEAPATRLQLPA